MYKFHDESVYLRMCFHAINPIGITELYVKFEYERFCSLFLSSDIEYEILADFCKISFSAKITCSPYQWKTFNGQTIRNRQC